MRSRPTHLSLALLAGTIAAGLAIRFAAIGLPLVIVKFGGSMLWALMIYWIVSAIFGSWRLFSVALLAGTLATLVEFFKLYHTPRLDAFRLTLPGILLLGRIFSAWDILAYWVAIVTGAFLDARFRRSPHTVRL